MGVEVYQVDGTLDSTPCESGAVTDRGRAAAWAGGGGAGRMDGCRARKNSRGVVEEVRIANECDAMRIGQIGRGAGVCACWVGWKSEPHRRCPRHVGGKSRAVHCREGRQELTPARSYPNPSLPYFTNTFRYISHFLLPLPWLQLIARHWAIFKHAAETPHVAVVVVFGFGCSGHPVGLKENSPLSLLACLYSILAGKSNILTSY